MKDVQIPRTGDVPLRFRGERLAYQSSRRLTGEDATRWHEMTAYRTDDGRYVLHVGWRTTWHRETSGDLALVVDRLEDAEEALEAAIPPLEALPGYPPLPHVEAVRSSLEYEATVRCRQAARALIRELRGERGTAGPQTGRDAPTIQAGLF